MQFLQAGHLNSLLSLRADAVHGRGGGGKCGDTGHAALDRGAANGFLVETRSATEWGIDDEVEFAALDEINHVGAAFIHFVNLLHLQAGSP